MNVEIHWLLIHWWYTYVRINNPYLVREVLDTLFVDRQNNVSLSQQATL